ncbi:M23 family metallopeptidase [Rhodoblastus sp.]|uniref:M23 family metallopeptidase n=1 Tax=Rhodoblastus sp. TaxID=1962975 RepID=UPI003F943363
MRARDSEPVRSRIRIDFTYRNFRRELALHPALGVAVFGFIPLILVSCLGVGFYSIFRDDMLASLIRGQARMQAAYEERIGALRSQIEVDASQRIQDRRALQARVADLAGRQARLEIHTAQVSALAAQIYPAAEAARLDPAATSIAVRHVPAPPAAKPALAVKIAKPAPAGFDLRGPQPLDPSGEDLSENVDTITPERKLRDLASNFDSIEQGQIAALENLRAPLAAKAARLLRAFDEANLPVDRLLRHAASRRPGKAGSGVGGPFEPAPVGADAFERAYAGVSQSLAAIDGLRGALSYAPLRQPLFGPLDVTSSFGFRTDPFLGRPALHSGMDLRGDTGDPVRATAAGRVVLAGPSGGYGNLVEIDHGAGLATRYGHLSQIAVEEGQWVEAGAVVGEIGSTGRSTGPHLHYEVRTDGVAVDPSRYLRAGLLLNSAL